MSRVGRKPVPVPTGVNVTIRDGLITVKGPKGELKRTVPASVTPRVEPGFVVVERSGESRGERSRHGLLRALIANMVKGVTAGYTRQLEINGVGYRAEAQGPGALKMALGYSHPVIVEAPEGVTFEVPQPTRVVVKGIDKEKVGQVAANIRSLRKPEPYKGKGVRYAGEKILRKAGKAGKK